MLAIGLLTVVYMVHYEHPLYLDQPAVVGWVSEGSAADKAGILAGDKIVQIGSTKNPDWEFVLSKIMISPHRRCISSSSAATSACDKTVYPDVVGTGPAWRRRSGGGAAIHRHPPGAGHAGGKGRVADGRRNRRRATALPSVPH